MEKGLFLTLKTCLRIIIFGGGGKGGRNISGTQVSCGSSVYLISQGRAALYWGCGEGRARCLQEHSLGKRVLRDAALPGGRTHDSAPSPPICAATAASVSPYLGSLAATAWLCLNPLLSPGSCSQPVTSPLSLRCRQRSIHPRTRSSAPARPSAISPESGARHAACAPARGQRLAVSEHARQRDGLEKLILLNLNNNKLKYLPPEIHRLENLENMNLNNNQLESVPKELCSLQKLSELHLSHNCLITVPEEIGYMTNLRMLCLSRNQIGVLPDGLCKLRKLRILDVAGNKIQIFPIAMEDLMLMELYCEDNPLLQKQPVSAIQEEEVWSLKEIVARFIFSQLTKEDSILHTAVKKNLEACNILSKKQECAQCGQGFLNTWLECVRFVNVGQKMKISRNVHLLPVRTLLCSYKCFNHPGHGFFGIAVP
nr:leucine-rich repeat-containing protein 69 isoform X2 [Caretta caretta]